MAFNRLRFYMHKARDVYGHPLHQGRGTAAVLEWVGREVAAALSRQPTIISYVNDTRLIWPRGASSVAICAAYGLGEFRDMAFVLHLLRPEDLFCDVGANAGVYTVLASGAVRCRTVAIEPIPSTFDVLKSNIAINGASDRVDALNYGVGSSSGTLRFTSSLWSFNHVVPGGGGDTVEMATDTLDNLLQGRVPRLIKIDVEGFEGEVLKGAQHTLAESGVSAVLMEVSSNVSRYGQTKEGLKAQLGDIGFEPFWYSPFERRLIEPGQPRSREWNLIFERDPTFIAQRVTNAPKYRVHGREF